MSYQGRIPVPGVVTSVRSNKRERRLQLEQLHKKRQTDLEQQEKQRRQAEEVAQILAQRWADEDRKKKWDGRWEADEDHRPRGLSAAREGEGRLDRPAWSRGEERDDFEIGNEEDLRRGGTPRHGRKDGIGETYYEPARSSDTQRRSGGQEKDIRALVDEFEPLDGGLQRLSSRGGEHRQGRSRPESPRQRPEQQKSPPARSFRERSVAHRQPPSAEEEEQGPAGAVWHSVERPQKNQERKGEASTGSGEALGREKSQKEEPKQSKLKGVFGISDSEEERETARSEMELVARRKRARLSPQLTEAMRSAAPASGGPAPPSSVAAVQMKVVQWKYGLKGRAAEMPEELRREVAAVMGVSMGR